MTHTPSEPAVTPAAHAVSSLTPRLVDFWNEKVAFTGEIPHLIDDLTSLLPEGIVTDEEAIPDGVTLVVIGMDDYSEDLLQEAASLEQPPRFVPQEAYLDHLLCRHRFRWPSVEA